MADASPPTLALRTLQARAGLLWVQQGIAACARNPLGFTALLVVTTLGFQLIAQLPLIGPAIALMAMPFVWLAYMRATRLTLGGQRFGLQVLADIWRVPAPRRNALVRVSSLYVAAVLACFVVVVLVYRNGPDAGLVGKLLQAMEDKRQEDVEALLAGSRLWVYALLLSSLLSVVSLVFWHAPALAHALGMRPGKALFFSAMACWHNRAAFLVYGLAWGALGFLVMLVSALAGQLLQSEAAAAVIALPSMVLLMASFYASLHFSTADCFQAQFEE
ncbi:MAG: hypothetical protein EPO01_06045 [Aquabacterium sp.]|nr:MAG: hypothetical protein EPO01_06045 [Aquabacterium sp.]